MKIGELAQRSGLATSAIRYYERAGLLPKAKRGSNGYREYDEVTLEQLHVIDIGQSLGFTLDAIRAVLALEGKALQDGLIESLDARLVEIDKMMLALQAQRASLLETEQKLRQSWVMRPCVNSEPAPPARPTGPGNR
jgi:DNA-binding transcriptional MerR regulator